jgi:demethylmenaquinone methyltransferase/2-methoxy-6-polyprenyl-1,4-benzoquinol methylase
MSLQKMFGEISGRYDFTNRVLSFNLHKSWNRKLVDTLAKSDIATLLDLCAGTGEIAYSWLKRQAEPKKAILLDFSPEMLAIAKTRKPPNHEIILLHADAQAIPLPDQSVEAIALAYGIRNVPNPPRCLLEAYRVLKPGGTLAILELTEPQNPLLAPLHRFYLNHLLPRLGGWLSGKTEAYRYLSKSIQAFIKPDVLAKQLKAAGFASTEQTPLTFGIAHLISAKK